MQTVRCVGSTPTHASAARAKTASVSMPSAALLSKKAAAFTSIADSASGLRRRPISGVSASIHFGVERTSVLRPVLAMRERPSPQWAERSCATAPRSSWSVEREEYADFLKTATPVLRLRGIVR